MRFKLILFFLSTVALQCKASRIDDLVSNAHKNIQDMTNAIIVELTQGLEFKRHNREPPPAGPGNPYASEDPAKHHYGPRPSHTPDPYAHGKYPPPPPPPPHNPYGYGSRHPPGSHAHGNYPPPPPPPPHNPCGYGSSHPPGPHAHGKYPPPHNHDGYGYNSQESNEDNYDDENFDKQHHHFEHMQMPDFYGLLNNPIYDYQNSPGHGYGPYNPYNPVQRYPNTPTPGNSDQKYTSSDNNFSNESGIHTTESYDKYTTVFIPIKPSVTHKPIHSELGGDKETSTAPTIGTEKTTLNPDDGDEEVSIDIRFNKD